MNSRLPPTPDFRPRRIRALRRRASAAHEPAVGHHTGTRVSEATRRAGVSAPAATPTPAATRAGSARLRAGDRSAVRVVVVPGVRDGRRVRQCHARDLPAS